MAYLSKTTWGKLERTWELEDKRDAIEHEIAALTRTMRERAAALDDEITAIDDSIPEFQEEAFSNADSQHRYGRDWRFGPFNN